MHVLYQQWSLILEAFYLGSKGKFCGICQNHFLVVSYYLLILNYAKQLHLICRTLTISLIIKHLSILPFKLHPTKERVPFCLCITLVSLLHYPLCSSPVFLWSSSQGERTHRKENQQLHHHLCWRQIFSANFQLIPLFSSINTSSIYNLIWGLLPHFLQMDAGGKKGFLPKYLCILFITSKI